MATVTTTPDSIAERADQFSAFEWIQLHSRELTFALIGLVAVGAGIAFYKRSGAIKEERAERAYYTAMRSSQAGNKPLAIADLDKVILRYNGTAAAALAAMSSAELQYDAGRPAEGVKSLQKVSADGAAKPFAASIAALLADGLVDQGKASEAATKYREAAEKAVFPADRDIYLANAARALQAAGKKDEALKLWQQLASDAESVQSAEAHVRIGELSAKPAK